jgi:hypothetical protein
MPIRTLIQNEASKGLLRYAVGQQMFCPYCERILDAKRAVLIDVVYKKDRKTAVMTCCCASCEPVAMSQICRGINAAKAKSQRTGDAFIDAEIEVTDGRLLWGPKQYEMNLEVQNA